MDTSTPLQNQVAVVTGASRGIGAAIARRLARDGAAVVVNYASNRERADAVVTEIAGAGGRAVAVAGDVADPATGASLAQTALDHFGRVNILVNNAGIYALDNDATRLFAVNVVGLLNVSNAFAAVLGQGASIVNISSAVGRDPFPMAVAYSASKAAVDSITRAHARALGPKGIRVNAVAPGYTETEMSPADGGDFHTFALSASPLGRIGTIEGVADAVAFLVAPTNEFITGTILAVDGASRM